MGGKSLDEVPGGVEGYRCPWCSTVIVDGIAPALVQFERHVDAHIAHGDRVVSPDSAAAIAAVWQHVLDVIEAINHREARTAPPEGMERI